jgi:outer membrane protein OmpA-like peptidoglycan-associated protein
MTANRIRGIVVTLFFLLLTGSTSLVQAQNVEKLLVKANKSFAGRDFVSARDQYQQVMAADAFNQKAAIRLGLVNFYMQQYEEALRWYRKAIEIEPNRNDTVYFYVGTTYKMLSNYRKARESLDEFLKRHTQQDEYRTRAELEKKGCDFAEANLSERPAFRINRASFNSAAGDMFPAVLDQRQEDKFIVFTSYRPLPGKKPVPYSAGGEPAHCDLYTVVMENDSIFGEPYRFPGDINTKMNDGTASFTGDGLTMYYTVCNDKKNAFGCSIYESKYDPIKKDWGKAALLESIAGTKQVVVNSKGKTKKAPTDDRQPFVTKDGRTLYFVSDRDGGEGGFDIWISRKVGLGWSEPVNAGPVINTAFNDLSPFITDAGNRLYFASDGHGGFGGYDIYVSQADEMNLDSWGEPMNLGAPINSSFNDFGSIWLDTDSLVYFSSNRPGGMGSHDIYWGRMIVYPEPIVELAVHGLIRDKITKEPIPFATAILYEKQEDNSLIALDTFNTDQTAAYNFPLEREKVYTVLGNAPEYLANEVEVSTLGLEESTDIERNIDIELEPIVIDKPIVLQNIYYDFDEYYLRPDALTELNRLVKILRDNPNITIQMGSHTDSNGTEPYNKKLSERRAMSAVKYLVDSGISPDRLAWFGFGESQLLYFPEQSDEEEQANRRTEFRITSIEYRP